MRASRSRLSPPTPPLILAKILNLESFCFVGLSSHHNKKISITRDNRRQALLPPFFLLAIPPLLAYLLQQGGGVKDHIRFNSTQLLSCRSAAMQRLVTLGLLYNGYGLPLAGAATLWPFDNDAAARSLGLGEAPAARNR